MTDRAASAASAASAQQFLDLHKPGEPLLIPNPWDAGSARLLVSLGYQALATTSSGFAATLGRFDGSVTREEAIDHAAAVVAAVDVPVSADLEHGFGDEPAAVVETVEAAIAAGLAGCSIEDSTGNTGDPIYDAGLARDRIAAAAEAAHRGAVRLVLTARSENYLHGRPDLGDTISRLQSFEEAGADVLYAPGLTDLNEIRTLVSSVGRPVNVLALPNAPTVSELAAVGVARISVGGAFAFVALGALADAGRELMDKGTYGYWAQAGTGSKAALNAFR